MSIEELMRNTASTLHNLVQDLETVEHLSFLTAEEKDILHKSEELLTLLRDELSRD